MTQDGSQDRRRSEPQIIDDHIKRLRRSCGSASDGAVHRLMLANALLDANRREDALIELRWVVRFDPTSVAAWRLIGLTLVKMGAVDRAVRMFNTGIRVAMKRGNVPAARELKKFLRRLKR